MLKDLKSFHYQLVALSMNVSSTQIHVPLTKLDHATELKTPWSSYAVSPLIPLLLLRLHTTFSFSVGYILTCDLKFFLGISHYNMLGLYQG